MDKMISFLIILAILPLVWWGAYANFTSTYKILLSTGQATALVGSVLLSLNFVLAARYILLEKMFNGLNKLYKYHHLIGAIAFSMLLLHPTMLFWVYGLGTLQMTGVLMGSLALAILSGLLILTLFIKLPYDLWKKTHQYMGLVLLLAGIHGLKIGSTLALSWPLKIYILGWMGIGLTSALVRLFNLRLKFHQHDYHVSEVKVVKDWIMMKLSPENKALKYEPGQFVFLRFDSLGISPESHPFSLAGNPTEKFLTIVVKSFGSYTETLKLLKVDAKVKVEGPYGRFNQKYGQFKKQIWIAGGIGVTPFRSMTSQLDGYDIRLFYCVNNKEEAWFDEEFRQINNPNFAYKLWVSKEMGYITADKIGEIDNCEVFICGPTPMMRSLTSQFKKLRVKNSNIHSEEFELY